jgi:hypothetical protein
VLKAGVAGVVAGQAAVLENLAVMPSRVALAATTPSDIQFDIGAFIAPAKTFNDGAGNVVAQFGPVFAVLAPAKLTRTPNIFDQFRLRDALQTIEQNFPMSPAGVFVHVHYGLPYFRRLQSGVFQRFVPRLASDNTRFVLEEAVASPTDVVNGFVGGVSPNVKERFNVNVAIEQNDVLFQIKSDSLSNANQVLAWLEGNTNTLNGNNVQSPNFNGLFQFQTARVQFVQPGLPRKVADQAAAGNPNLYEFHTRVNPNSSMVMGFVDQQANSSAPTAQVVTFQGTSTARLTTAQQGDYFDNGAICHFSHDIDDLYQFYALPNQDSRAPAGESFQERFQYMFRSNELGTTHGLATEGDTDQFFGHGGGGGPAFVNNPFQGTDTALRGARDSKGVFAPGNQNLDATFEGVHRFGHEQALQRSSRAADGTPLHIRNDGPGFSSLDVTAFQTFPGGTNVAAGSTQFKLEFLIFVPTAEFFRVMRVNSASRDLVAQFPVAEEDAALERFITATRRQNFLTPPRRHRAFPLVEKQ